MSGFTQTQPEVYYSFSSAGTALNTFTSEASLMGTYPIPAVPGTYFNKTGNLSSTAKVRAAGQISSTATPTFSVSLRLLSSATSWSAGGILLGTTTALATASGVAGGWWLLDADVTLRSIAAGAATSTLMTAGTLSGSAFPATTGTMPAASVSAVSSTLDNTGATAYYLWVSAACGTSSASNTISLQALKVYLEN